MRIKMIKNTDCLKGMKELQENSVDAIVTDPPYGLSFMGKKWDYNVPSVEIWKEALRVLKPGGYLLSFAGTRTYHRMVINVEDAGFEIRDMISWLYGSGFPKSLNISKAIDKRNGRTDDYPELREYLKKKRAEKKLTIKQVADKLGVYQALYGFYEQKNTGSQIPSKRLWGKLKNILDLDNSFDKLIARIEAKREIIGKDSRKANYSMFMGEGNQEWDLTKPNLLEAKQWGGWGTALKPACEPIVVARKPLSEKNVVLNVLKWGTGGINIDACRIGTNDKLSFGSRELGDGIKYGKCNPTTKGIQNEQGRFPANIILDEEAGKMMPNDEDNYQENVYKQKTLLGDLLESENKSASRFFYCAKASKSERNDGLENLNIKKSIGHNRFDKCSSCGGYLLQNKDRPSACKCINPQREDNIIKGNHHPTVKPIKLMEYLIKLVSKENATILDPFGGSGTTAIAATKLNRQSILFEKSEEYCKIAEARLKPYLTQTRLNTPNATSTKE